MICGEGDGETEYLSLGRCLSRYTPVYPFVRIRVLSVA